MRNCPKGPQEWTQVRQKSSSTLHKISQEKQPDLTTSNVAVLSPKRVHAEAPVAAATVTHAETTDAPTSEIPTLDPTVQSLPSAAPMVVDPQVVPSEISSTPPELGSVSGSDVEMEDASSPSPQDFFLALPAPFFYRPINPLPPSSLEKALTSHSATCLNPFTLPPPSITVFSNSPNHTKPSVPPKPPIPSKCLERSSALTFSVISNPNPFSPLLFDLESSTTPSSPLGSPSAHREAHPNL